MKGRRIHTYQNSSAELAMCTTASEYQYAVVTAVVAPSWSGSRIDA